MIISFCISCIFFNRILFLLKCCLMIIDDPLANADPVQLHLDLYFWFCKFHLFKLKKCTMQLLLFCCCVLSAMLSTELYEQPQSTELQQ